MRLFVALPLPETIRDALLDPMEGLSGARWQDADNLHVTLRFIGEVTGHEADDIACALANIDWRGFPIALRGVGHFEKKHRAKAIWARVEPSRELADLQARIEYACRRAGLAAEERKFIPHVTLARLNSTSGDAGLWLAKNEGLSLGPWLAESFALYESQLAPGGSQYLEIQRFGSI